MEQPLLVRNAWVGGRVRDLVMGTHIVEAPLPGALPVDLAGYRIWPGLINAHDHLELNHFPRSKFRPLYQNAHQWGEEMNARLNTRPYKRGRAALIDDRLFIGGLKNLLCGALTVVHHNTLYPQCRQPDYPVCVLLRYGWAHSLHFERDVVKSYHKVEPDVPWIIHLAEGVDDTAALEYGRLKKKGLVQPNTVLVHGVGLTHDDMLNGARTLRGLVWCPSSNRYLLGHTANIELWRSIGGRAALGSDSRLTADGDLLDELLAADETGQVDSEALLELVTTAPAEIFDLHDAGALCPGMRADWIATRIDRALVGSKRADLALVVRGGVPQIGDPDLMVKFPAVETIPVTLDGQSKLMRRSLAERVLACELEEPGLVVEGKKRHRTRRWQKVRSRIRGVIDHVRH